MRMNLNELRSIVVEAMLNAYDVLGVPRNASEEEIKKAWKALAIKNHPDRGGDHGTMVNINAAKDRLLDKMTLLRKGAVFSGYEDPNAPKKPAAQPPPSSQHQGTHRASNPLIQKCAWCGRNVAGMRKPDGKWFNIVFVNHYTEKGGQVKCAGSGQNIWDRPNTRTSNDPAGAAGRDRWTNNPPPPRPSSKRYFTFVAGRSSKFWETEIVGGTTVRVRFGRIGSPGREKQKTYRSPREAAKVQAQMIRRKLDKGYVERAGQQSASSAPGAAQAPRGGAQQAARPTKDTYKVYSWKGGRRVVRIKGKLYGTGAGGRVMDPTNPAGGYQTRFNANDHVKVSPRGRGVKVGSTSSDHTQDWDPVEEVFKAIDTMIVEMIVKE